MVRKEGRFVGGGASAWWESILRLEWGLEVGLMTI